MNTLLTSTERERYRRQMMLPGFTAEHQEQLKRSTVLVAGVGGLGGTAALYLAAAGIGRLVLVHSGNLTLSNMNRQVLMDHAWIGKSRVLRAKRSLQELNPGVAVDIFDERITPSSVERFFPGVSLALSARPNFPERSALNRACVQRGIPMVEAAMNGMEGYLFNVVPGVSPCLACLFPEHDPAWEELGFPVLGAVSGVLGCLMAVEAVKLLAGYGAPLLSHMLVFHALDMDFRKFAVRRDPACPVCGQSQRQLWKLDAAAIG